MDFEQAHLVPGPCGEVRLRKSSITEDLTKLSKIPAQQKKGDRSLVFVSQSPPTEQPVYTLESENDTS
jgi:hypothetical protein